MMELPVVPSQAGVGVLLLYIGFNGGGIVSQTDGADTFIRGRYQNMTQRPVNDGVGYLDVLSTFSIRVRRHAQLGRGFLIQAAGGAVSGVVQSAGYGLTLLQPGL